MRYLPSGKVQIAVLLIFVCALYAQTLRFDFVHFDEDELIIDRQSFLQSINNVPKAFTTDTAYPFGRSVFYRPVQTLSFMVDAHIAGDRPLWYHGMNIALHVAGALLVLAVLRALSFGPWAALGGALAFAAHPALVPAVAWVPGRNDILTAIPLLASFWFFIRYAHTQKRIHLIAHALLWFVALGAKEYAIVLPFVAYAYAVLVRRWHWRTAFTLPEGVAWIGGWILYAVARTLALAHVQTLSFGEAAMSVLRSGGAFLEYITKAVVPVRLALMPTGDLTNMIIGGVLALGALITIIVFRKKTQLAQFGFVWFVLFLLPSLVTNEPTARQVFFENRLYLPIVGIIIAALNLVRLLPRKPLLIARGALVAVAIFFAFHTTQRLPAFQNSETYWTLAAAQSPNLARAQDGLGTEFFRKRNVGQALFLHQRALALHPEAKRVWNNIGSAYLFMHNIPAAQDAFAKEIERNPGFPPAYHNLAITLLFQGKEAEAEQLWRQALAINPWYSFAHQGLALMTAQTGRLDEAREHILFLERAGVALLPELIPIRDALFPSPSPSPSL